MNDQLRTAMQAALEALELHAKQYPHMVKGYTLDATEELRAALAEPQQESCVWAQADSDTDLWETSCGRSFRLDEGTPAENHMKWCCYCGKQLDQHPWVDEEAALQPEVSSARPGNVKQPEPATQNDWMWEDCGTALESMTCPWCDRQDIDICQHADDAKNCEKK